MSEPSVPPPPPTAAAGPSNKGVMIVLAYLWILTLVPLLTEKEDREVQWHAKHGLVLLIAEFIFWVAITVIGMVSGGLGCVFAPLTFFVWLAILVVHIICIVKGLNGERFIIPGLSQYADRF